jgi:hypothetical protein
MFSARKSWLRLIEWLTIAAVVVATCLGIAAFLQGERGSPLELLLLALFALLMVTFAPACVLAGEYVRTVRQPNRYREHVAGLAAHELKALVRWSPFLYKATAVAGFVVALVVGLVVGQVSWSDTDPLTSREAAAASLYLACFYLFALPVIGSAARMPGSYSAALGDGDAV